MTLFRRSWPKHLERRRPENAATRKQIDEQHREHTKRTAELAVIRTENNQVRIDRIADILFRRT